MPDDLSYLANDPDLQRRFDALNPQRGDQHPLSPASKFSPAALPNTAQIRRDSPVANNGLHPLFRAALLDAGLPLPVCEYKFHDARKWRLDYAWPDHRVALEVEGGAYIQGRHTRGKGFVADLAKYSEAAAMGWLVIRCVPDDICATVTLDRLKRALEQRKAA